MIKIKLLITIYFFLFFQAAFALNLVKDGSFEKIEISVGDTNVVDTMYAGWYAYYKPDSIPMLSDDGDTLYMVESANYRGPVIRLKEKNDNHYIYVDPISFPDNQGLDLMLWQDLPRLSPGAYELRFKVRSSISSFQSNVIDPVYPGFRVKIKDVTGNFKDMAETVTSFRESNEWRMHIVNFSITKPETITRILFGFDRYCRIDLDDIELNHLPNIIATFKALLPVSLQNEGLADFESGNYSSTMELAPSPSVTFTSIPPFPTVDDVARFKPKVVGGKPYDKDTVFYTPYISQGADPMQGAISWKLQTKKLSLDSANSHRVSLMTPMVNAISNNGQPVKLKMYFWGRTEGKDMVIRVDNLAGSGTSTKPRKVQNVLISGTTYKEYVVNDTMPAVMPRQEMYMVKPRYRFNFLSSNSTLHLDYIRFEYWDGISEGSPDYQLGTGLETIPGNVNATIIKRDNHIVISVNEPVLFQMFNTGGVLVKESFLESSIEINTSKFKGLHIVKLYGKSGDVSKKIIL